MTTRTVTKPTAEELRQALLRRGGSVTQTAVDFEVHRVTVHKWMRDYGIYLERRPVGTSLVNGAFTPDSEEPGA